MDPRTVKTLRTAGIAVGLVFAGLLLWVVVLGSLALTAMHPVAP